MLLFSLILQTVKTTSLEASNPVRLALTYDIRVLLEASGLYAKSILRDTVSSGDVCIEIKYTYDLKLTVLNNHSFSYSYSLRFFNIDYSGNVKEEVMKDINETFMENLDRVMYEDGVRVNPVLLFYFNVFDDSIEWVFKNFDEFYGQPRYVVIDRDVLAFHKVEAYETRSLESYSMRYNMFIYEVLTLTPLYVYYYEAVQKDSGRYRVFIKLDSEIDYNSRKNYYRIRSFSVVFENKSSASIAVVSLGEINVLIRSKDREILVNVSTEKECGASSVLLIVGYGNGGFSITGSNRGIMLYSNVSVPIYLSEVVFGNTMYNITFSYEIKTLENVSLNGFNLYQLSQQTLNMEYLVFTVFANILAIQGCFLLGALISKKVLGR